MIEQGTEHWDGTTALDFEFDDGGRSDAGYKGSAGDCVTRSIAIVSGKPYAEVYKALAQGMGDQRKSKGKTARNGVNTSRKWFKSYMQSIGYVWTPTMLIGSGCKVHLLADELPKGRLIVALSKHYTAVVDGVIRDTFNPTRTTFYPDEQGRAGGGHGRMAHRCVYGYWQAA